ncbi:hypothetical protein FHS43_000545 [Streptosporangium becharense]|uniref:Uncharacterized protein n=1 Tax=Streptosporangium becharense TaxID=1816182 RepID=A0A7W9MKN6_9ACTN|nr:hypothetical protein [Streptosporangium becharense]MBB5823798.1 hypothetical protein [Streptosporangium becharense]
MPSPLGGDQPPQLALDLPMPPLYGDHDPQPLTPEEA